MKRLGTLFVCLFSLIALTGCNIIFTWGPKKPKIEEITLNSERETLNAGEEFQLEVTTSPDAVGTEHLYFESENIGIASVDDEGLVKAKGNGTTNIVVSSVYDDSVQAKFEITSNGVSLNNYKLKTRMAHMHIGETKQLEKIVYPNNASNQDLIYTSSDEDVAWVDEDGLIYAEDIGSTTITAISEDKGIVDTCNVTVVDEDHITKTELKYFSKDYVDNTSFNFYDYSPHTGNVYVLVLPLSFSDTGTFISDKAQVKNDIETAFFGTNEETGWRSVKTFYEEESFGAIKINGVVADWYECGKPYSNYGVNQDFNTLDLINDALKDYKNKHNDIDWNLYDQDNNGHIDNVVAIYGAPTYTNLNKPEWDNLWSWARNEGYNAKVGKPTLGYYVFSSYTCMYRSAEDALAHTGKSSYFSGQGNTTIDAHVYIHEMGHMFGLLDYYDYGQATSPTGIFGMQDSDAFMHDPYSMLTFGWSQPYIPTSSCEIDLGNFVETGDCILLSPDFNKNVSPFDEYLLINVFSPTGLNENDALYHYNRSGDMDECGVQVWHVDARLVRGTNYNINNLTTLPVKNADGGIRFAFSNSSLAAEEERISPLGRDYAKYNMLYLVRNDTKMAYDNSYIYDKRDLFKQGDIFTMDKYKTQFPDGNKLDNGQSLGWQFEVASLNNGGATIKVTKL